MLKKNNFIADAVASDMAEIMESEQHRAVFAAPVAPEPVQKTASAPLSRKARKREQFRLIVSGMEQMSEALDNLGLEKSAAATILALQHIISEAQMLDDDDDDGDHDEDDKDDRDEKKDEDKDEEKDGDHDEDDEDDEGDDDDTNLKGAEGYNPFANDQHHPSAPNTHYVPGAGYNKPQTPPQNQVNPGAAPRPAPAPAPAAPKQQGQSADDSGAHGAYQSAIDVGIKDDSGMADDVGMADTPPQHDIFSNLPPEGSIPPPPENVPNQKPPVQQEPPVTITPSGKLPIYPPKATQESTGSDLSDLLMSLGKLQKEAKARGDFIFPKGSSKVKDNQDHFPINTEGRGRNALSRANQYSKAPSWYNGSLQSLVTTVANAVKRKYKGIDVSKASRVPGKGGGKKKSWHEYLDDAIIVEAINYGDYDEPGFDLDYAEMYEDIRAVAGRSRDDSIVALAKSGKSEGSYILPHTHAKVKSGDHFPINTEGRARNALSRVNQYSKAPKWWSGSLQELVNTVTRAVHSKYKGIKISEKSKRPGKG